MNVQLPFSVRSYRYFPERGSTLYDHFADARSVPACHLQVINPCGQGGEIHLQRLASAGYGVTAGHPAPDVIEGGRAPLRIGQEHPDRSHRGVGPHLQMQQASRRQGDTAGLGHLHRIIRDQEIQAADHIIIHRDGHRIGRILRQAGDIHNDPVTAVGDILEHIMSLVIGIDPGNDVIGGFFRTDQDHLDLFHRLTGNGGCGLGGTLSPPGDRPGDFP